MSDTPDSTHLYTDLEPQGRAMYESAMVYESISRDGLQRFENVLTYRYQIVDTILRDLPFISVATVEDPLCEGLHAMPCAFAAMFCRTQERFEMLAPRARDVRRLSAEAHEFQWDYVVTEPKLELWEVPWPMLGIPKGAGDISRDKVLKWLEIAYHPDLWRDKLLAECKRWKGQVENTGRVIERLPNEETRVRYEEMAKQVYKILLNLCEEKHINLAPGV